MLKPFYIKKKNIDDRLVPEVFASDAGKVLGVTEEGKIAPVEAGGVDALPEMTSADGGKILVVGTDGKLKLFKSNYPIICTSEDMTNWTADITFNQLSEIIAASTVPLMFNFEFYVNTTLISYAANVVGGYIQPPNSDAFVSFMLGPTAYVTISQADAVTVYFD